MVDFPDTDTIIRLIPKPGTVPPATVTVGDWNDLVGRVEDLEALVIPTVVSDLTDVDTSDASDGDLLMYDGMAGEWVPYTPQAITVVSAFAAVIDETGSTIATGVKLDLPPFTFDGVITGWCLLADQSGDISVQAWKDSYGNYPPVVADLLFTATITGATKAPSSGGYTTVNHPFSTGDTIRFNVSGTPANIERVTVGLRVSREVGP